MQALYNICMLTYLKIIPLIHDVFILLRKNFRNFLRKMSYKNFLTKKFHFLIKLILVLFLSVILIKLFISMQTEPYYNQTYHSEETTYYELENNSGFNLSELTCNPYNQGKEDHDFQVKLNGEYYPKVVPMYHRKQINFTCLNQPGPKIKTILLWNKFLGVPLFPYGEG